MGCTVSRRLPCASCAVLVLVVVFLFVHDAGDCYLLASLSAIAEEGGGIESLIVGAGNDGEASPSNAYVSCHFGLGGGLVGVRFVVSPPRPGCDAWALQVWRHGVPTWRMGAGVRR